MRIEYDFANTKKFKCCFFVHVRAGAIILGIWHMFVHILVLSCLVASSLHPELLRDSLQPSSPMDRSERIVLFGTNNSNKDSGAVFEIQYEARQKNLNAAFALIIGTVLIALLMVYGAIQSRPAYLMPFFCLQVFDFCLACLTFVGYMTYTPDVKLWIKEQKMEDFPGMNRLLQMDDQWLMLLFVILFVLFLTLKAYMINLVWMAYQYMKLVNARSNTVQSDTELLLPPKYEEAMRFAHNESTPPPYVA